MDPKDSFYRHFHDSVQVLQDQIAQLGSFSTVGGERQEATDHILAGISKLQNEVADAAEFTPAYDRKRYSEAVKEVQDGLNETIAKLAPKSRFQFKRTVKTTHVDMGAPENDPRLHPGSMARNPHDPQPAPGATTSPLLDKLKLNLRQDDQDKDYNEELARPGLSSLRKPSFSAAKSIAISDQSDLHIILPASAGRATAAGFLRNIHGCIVDMSVPKSEWSPFPGLILKDIRKSLVVAGRVAGAIHINGVEDSVLVVIAHQVRIHECRGVDIYLHCTSHPIIEDCSGMRFAPLPEHYMTDADRGLENMWDRVDDFKWLKQGDSPNWTTLPEDQRLNDEIWTNVVPGQAGVSVDETLRKVGIEKKAA